MKFLSVIKTMILKSCELKMWEGSAMKARRKARNIIDITDDKSSVLSVRVRRRVGQAKNCIMDKKPFASHQIIIIICKVNL